MVLEIVTPDKSLFSGTIHLVKVPGSKGSFEILNNHAPIISTLDKGSIKVVSPDGSESFFDVTGGVVEVLKNKITILATTD